MKQILMVGVSAFLLAGCVTAPPPSEPSTGVAASSSGRSALDQKIAFYANLYNVPVSLVHRVVQRESRYNPAARNGPYWGLMQIRYDTAQGMGYRGPASGLLNAETNMTYAVAYLSNAYKLSGGSHDRAVRLYAGGYYYEAKRQGKLDQMITARR